MDNTARIIVLYGKPGLDTDILKSYLIASGYHVKFVTTWERALETIIAHPSAITVIAVHKEPRELMQLAHEIRAGTHDDTSHIMIMNGEKPFKPDLPRVEVIIRPYYLSDAVHRIEAITKDSAFNSRGSRF